MIIVCLDPGTYKTGVGCYDTKAQSPVLHSLQWLDNDEVLEALTDRNNFFGADALAIEIGENQGNNVSDAFVLTQLWAGRFMQRWVDYNNRAALTVKPKEIRKHFTGKVFIKRSIVHSCLKNRFGVIDASGKLINHGQGRKDCAGPLYGGNDHSYSALEAGITLVEGGTAHEFCPF